MKLEIVCDGCSGSLGRVSLNNFGNTDKKLCCSFNCNLKSRPWPKDAVLMKKCPTVGPFHKGLRVATLTY